jgi:acetyl-CoA carboxylase biotin carboxyl carrier protein
MKFGGRGPPFPDADLIRTLAALLTETGLTEIEYARRSPRPRRPRRGRASASVSAPFHQLPPDRSAPGTVKAPMVGTAYLAPQPGAPPLSISAMSSPKASRS